MEFKIPGELKITYENHLDLKKIHKVMLELFDETQEERLKGIKKCIKNAKGETPKTPIEIEILEEKLQKLREIRYIVKNQKDKEEYIEKVTPVIKCYKEIELPEPKSTESKSTKTETSSEVSTTTSEKQENKMIRKFIEDFIAILHDYISIDVSRDDINTINDTIFRN